ncbi:MAG: ribose 5-phosphate isomerase [Petroclostridium sp.]|jgi:ribose 5-phosphate isomerase B|uniref:ribose 5-phosphate isomerase B n=1 Tax=Petroclostridium xylanilyticum TaxID=1792311 RepID=UPI000B985381|nr:ribose 5-phosphate isomerase B [Petroclostridium xylanilyticum]MBZ4646745.1 sugar-phosphate isomerase, RpiB/LacA/LacB family [Clostridia bacterium]MDK2811093.1 ribose 5-phosphate isomerase [Petroclostridium sp.]
MIAIGSDHGGFELKEEIKKYLLQEGHEVKDFGVDSPVSVDYPDIAHPVCMSVINGECEKGILVCGTGIGISIAANKIHGIRAALCGDCFSARMAKEHNNANVIALGGRVVGPSLAIEIVNAWLKAEFQGGRHQTRVDKIHSLENK